MRSAGPDDPLTHSLSTAKGEEDLMLYPFPIRYSLFAIRVLP
jgi:hypothetical protein